MTKVCHKISIITPSYNQSHYLEQTICSVLDQHYPRLEYITIDGGSSDGSIDVITKYEKFMSFWVSQPDRGQSHALNKGFAKATGNILCWLNSDDVFLPGALQVVADFFLQHPDAMWCTGQILGMDAGGAISPEPLPVIENAELLDWFLHFREGRSIIQQPATFWRREVWERVGPLREDLHYAFDFEFFLRVRLLYGEPCRLDKPLAAFRFHDNSKTCQGTEPFFLENLRVIRENLHSLPPAERRLVRQWLLQERTRECFIRQQKALSDGNMPDHWAWRMRGIFHRLSGRRLAF